MNENVAWYELTQEERIDKFFCKFSINDFWKWWNPNNNKVMEVRIKDFNLIKQFATKYQLSYSLSGIYVKSEYELKNVIKCVRDNNVVAWFGINSKKLNYNKFGNKSYSGNDSSIDNIEYVFIDIDRVNKNGAATNDDLMKCDILSNKIIERMKKHNWDRKYIKLCTGNGIQLLFELDIPIKLPNLSFDMQTKTFKDNEEFEKMRSLIREGIGKEIRIFCNRFREELGVEVDKTVFNIGRVASLPFTKNFKYGGFTWRGIIDMSNGVNSGLSDYCMQKQVYDKHYSKVFVKQNMNHTKNINDKELINHPLIRFMLDNDLPRGQINNLLWMQVKCIIRDSNLDFSNENVRIVHKLLQEKYKDSFPTNFPEHKYFFDEKIINRYCANNLIPPVYDLKKLRIVKENFIIENLEWNNKDIFNSDYSLKGEDFFDDMRLFKTELCSIAAKRGKSYFNNNTYVFINACIKKYGEQMTKYFFDYWLETYLCFR